MTIDRTLVFQILEEVELFKNLSHEELWDLLEAGEWKKASEGEKIITAGDLDLWMYILIKGQAEVVFGDKLISVLEAGDAFGEFGLMGERRTADVVAKTQCLLLALNADRLNHMPIILQGKLLRRILVSLMMRLQNVNRHLFLSLPAHWK